MALASTVIALSALIFSIRESRQSRKHNEVSVRPTVHVLCKRELEVVQMILINGGLGPAIITQLEFWMIEPDGRGKPLNEIDNWRQLLNVEELGRVEIAPTATIPLSAGEELVVLEVQGCGDSAQTSAELARNTLTASCVYEDMYGKIFGEDEGPKIRAHQT